MFLPPRSWAGYAAWKIGEGGGARLEKKSRF
jgi:hypothetical protein